MKFLAAICLFVMLVLGSNMGHATGLAKVDESTPAFSPDGSQIAYTSDKVGGRRIWVRGVDGKLPRQVTKLQYETQPAWSPDGKQIVFQSYGKTKNGPFAIWVVNVDGTNPHQLIEPAGKDGDSGDQYPCWSLDGQHIAFTHGSKLWIMDRDGSNAHALMKPRDGFQYCGQWSPSGQQIAFLESSIGTEYKIWIVGSDGKEQSLVSTSVLAHQVRWSRDGQFLYYNTGDSLMKIAASGKGTAQKLLTLKNEDAFFDISPDEKLVAYDDDGPDGDGKLYIKPLGK